MIFSPNPLPFQQYIFRLEPGKVDSGKGKCPYDPKLNSVSALISKYLFFLHFLCTGTFERLPYRKTRQVSSTFQSAPVPKGYSSQKLFTGLCIDQRGLIDSDQFSLRGNNFSLQENRNHLLLRVGAMFQQTTENWIIFYVTLYFETRANSFIIYFILNHFIVVELSCWHGRLLLCYFLLLLTVDQIE